MAQAARRPVSPAATGAPRPRLRAVPPPRGPSPQVVRRRRAVALAGLLVLAGLPLGALLSGGGGSEADRVAALLSRGAASPQTLCDHLSSGMLRAAGGRDACRTASPERGRGGEVGAVRVEGDRATAVVYGPDGEDAYALVRQDGEWKVDDVR